MQHADLLAPVWRKVMLADARSQCGDEGDRWLRDLQAGDACVNYGFERTATARIARTHQ